VSKKKHGQPALFLFFLPPRATPLRGGRITFHEFNSRSVPIGLKDEERLVLSPYAVHNACLFLKGSGNKLHCCSNLGNAASARAKAQILQPGVHRLALKSKHPEHAFVHAAKGLQPNEALKAFDSESEFAQRQRPFSAESPGA